MSGVESQFLVNIVMGTNMFPFEDDLPFFRWGYVSLQEGRSPPQNILLPYEFTIKNRPWIIYQSHGSYGEYLHPYIPPNGGVARESPKNLQKIQVLRIYMASKSPK